MPSEKPIHSKRLETYQARQSLNEGGQSREKLVGMAERVWAESGHSQWSQEEKEKNQPPGLVGGARLCGYGSWPTTRGQASETGCHEPAGKQKSVSSSHSAISSITITSILEASPSGGCIIAALPLPLVVDLCRVVNFKKFRKLAAYHIRQVRKHSRYIFWQRALNLRSSCSI